MITSRHLCRAGARAVVVGLVLTVGACQKKGGAEQAPDPAGRVNAVQVSKSERVDPPEEFCDTYRGPDRAETLEWPALKRDPPAPADGWRWINVWATWCEPCVEELPHLSDWAEELRDAGLSDLSLIAVEESRSAVATFRDKHPETPPSRVVAKPDAVKKWFASIGLGKGAPLPVHAFVDGAGRVRCLRAGPVDEDDLPTIENMIEK